MSFIWTDWNSKWHTVFSIPTTDEMILAQGCVSLVSTLSIFLIMLWSMTSFRHDYTLTASHPMRYSCLLSMFFFFLQSFLQLTGINNAFVNISKLSCEVFYPSQLLAYNFAKISLFWLFSFRLQLLCDSNIKLKISSLLLNLYRISCLIIPTLLWIAWIYFTFPDTKPHDTVTANNKYQDCFPETFPHSFIAKNIVGGGVVLADVFYSLTALIAFIIKCYQVSMLISNTKNHKNQSKSIKYHLAFQSANVYHHILSPKSNRYHNVIEDDQDDVIKNESLKKSEEMSHTRLMKKMENMAVVIKKSTFLTTICMISTIFYTIGGAYILRQIGFFLCFDGVIASLCMACLFKFGDDLYGFLFSRMEKGLFWVFWVLSCGCCICCRYWNSDDIMSSQIAKVDEEDKRSLMYAAEVNNNCVVATNKSSYNAKMNANKSLSVNSNGSLQIGHSVSESPPPFTSTSLSN